MPKIWPKIYFNVWQFTLDGFSRDFYFELINNILQLNVNLFRAGFAPSPLCSYCNNSDETPTHLFYECTYAQNLWRETQTFFIRDLSLPDLFPWSARLVLPLKFVDIARHIHFIFMMTLYKNRAAECCSFSYLKNKIFYCKKIELNVKFNSTNHHKISLSKWSKIENSWN